VVSRDPNPSSGQRGDVGAQPGPSSGEISAPAPVLQRTSRLADGNPRKRPKTEKRPLGEGAVRAVTEYGEVLERLAEGVTTTADFGQSVTFPSPLLLKDDPE
jgi:hypothetical protein